MSQRIPPSLCELWRDKVERREGFGQHRMESSLEGMNCREHCGACCIAPSITSPIPGMPNGKPAGIPCVQLLPDYRCALFGKPERPPFCSSLRPTENMCGTKREEALAYLAELELSTRP